jgi:hypothetical protein
MHADFQELLNLRDGQPLTADAAQHIAGCARCSLELSRLQRLAHQLQQLPQFEPPTRGWSAIAQQLDQLPKTPTQRGWKVASAAAVTAVLVALALLRSAQVERGTAPEPIELKDSAVIADAKSIGALVTRSQQLEAILQRLPQRPSVERAATSATIDELQNRIEVLDLQLSNLWKDDRNRAQARLLWSARVQLLNSLVYVRYAEAARDGYQPTNTLDTGVI